jgi:hypothetical protein
MSCCCGRAKDDVDVLNAVKLRFAKVEPKDFIALHHYVVAKIEQMMGRERGVVKEELAVKLITLLINDVATAEVVEFYKQIGGEDTTREIIRALCIAGGRGKACSKGV